MKSFLSFSFLLLATLVSAISSTGDRLLAVLDDVADKASYSKFLGDLKGAPDISFPKCRTHIFTNTNRSDLQAEASRSHTRRQRASRCLSSASARGSTTMSSSSPPRQRVLSLFLGQMSDGNTNTFRSRPQPNTKPPSPIPQPKGQHPPHPRLHNPRRHLSCLPPCRARHHTTF